MITMSRIYQWYSAALLAGFFLSASGGWQDSSGKNSLCITVCCLLFLFLSCVQSAGKRGYAAALLLTTGLLGFPVIRAGVQAPFSFAYRFLLWVFGQSDGFGGEILYFRVLFAALLTSCAFLLQGLSELFPKIKPAAALLLLTWLGYCLFWDSGLSKAGTAFAFAYLLLLLTELIQNRWKREQKHPVKAHVVWLFPFLTLYLIVVLLLPFPNKPYDWQWLKRAYTGIRESIVTLTWSLPFGSQEDYVPSYTGFSRDAALPGSIEHRTSELMLLETKGRFYTNLYLTGETYDHFTGRQWEQTADLPAFGRLLDPLLAADTCRRLQDPFTTDYMLRTSVSVRYLKFRTGYLFAPSKTLFVTQNRKRMDMSRTERWRFADRQSYGTQYEVDFYQLNTGQDEFWRFAEDAREPSDAEWKEILLEYKRINGQGLTLQDVTAYEDDIKALYGQPVVLSSPVREWLAEVTKDCETDVQRLLALERALSAYAYQLSPGDLPKTVSDASSFLEYLLLESREGYCAHFAGAFVLLSRALGIPSRYVQGYLVPAKGKAQAVVTSDMGHAWPEVYLSGIGWISFEPTPGYAQRFRASWQLQQRLSASAEEMPSSALGPLFDAQPDQNPVPDPGVSLSDEEAAENTAFMQILRVLRLLLPLALLLLAAVWYLERRTLFFRYGKLSAKERLYVQAHYGMKCLGSLHCKRMESETLQEFSRQAATQLGNDAPLTLLSLYEALLYGAGDFCREDIDTAKEAVDTLLCLVRTKSRFRHLHLLLVKPFPD